MFISLVIISQGLLHVGSMSFREIVVNSSRLCQNQVLLGFSMIQVNVGSGNGLVPDSTKPWPKSKKLYGVSRPQWVNSLAPGKFEWNFRHVIFKQILVVDGWGISCEIALIWMSLDFTDDQSTLVHAMAWCRQAASHYLSQCWPSSLVPYGVTRPQWVNTLNSLVGYRKAQEFCECKLSIAY